MIMKALRHQQKDQQSDKYEMLVNLMIMKALGHSTEESKSEAILKAFRKLS